MKNLHSYHTFDYLAEYFGRTDAKNTSDIALLAIFVAAYYKNKIGLFAGLLTLISRLDRSKKIIDEVYDIIHILDLSDKARALAKRIQIELEKKKPEEDVKEMMKELRIMIQREKGDLLPGTKAKKIMKTIA